MIDGIEQFMKKLPALSRQTNPGMAAFLGFILGGIALGIYFRSFIDFIVPIGIGLLLYFIIGDFGVIGGAIVASLWGFFRSQESNQRLAQPGTNVQAT